MIAGFNISGWNYNDSYINKMYKGKPAIETVTIGSEIEAFATKYNSTSFWLTYKYINIMFRYNQLNEYGAITAEQTVYNKMNIFRAATVEKLKYDFKSWSFYTYSGIYADFKFSESVDIDFKNILSESKTPIIGISSGIGIAKAFNRYRIFADFYTGIDISNTFDQPSGYFKNTEIGFRFGFGYYVPNKK